jgi:hypothetical protein
MKLGILVVLFVLTLPSTATLQELDDFAKEMFEKEGRQIEIWRKEWRDRDAGQTGKTNQSTEPVGFEAVEWGSAPEKLRGVFNVDEAERKGRESVFRTGHFIGKAPVTVDFIYLDKRLVKVFLSFDGRYLDTIRDAFIERYGKPSRIVTDISEWEWKRVNILIMTDPGVGSLASLTTTEYFQYREQLKKVRLEATGNRQ